MSVAEDIRNGASAADVLEAAKADSFDRDENGKVQKSPRNIRYALSRLGASLWLDVFNEQAWLVWIDGEDVVNDERINRLRFAASDQFGITFPKDLFYDVVMDSAFCNKRNPVHEYFDGLRWDGSMRIDRWISTYFGAEDSPYVRGVSRVWLCAAAKRALEPGCKFDEMPVFESTKQGEGKSEGLAALCPERSWFTDALPLGADSKVVVERTRGILIAEVSEMQGLGEREVEHIKAFLSCSSDGPVRLAYGRVPVRKPRQFVCAGTTNYVTDYLRDLTGNRRFWPITCRATRVDELARDRDQLWAEAVAAVKAGESIRLPRTLWEAAAVQQAARQSEDPWDDVLAEAIGARDSIQSSEVWLALGIDVKHRTQRENTRLGRALRRLGFERVTIRVGSGTHKGWKRIPKQLEL